MAMKIGIVGKGMGHRIVESEIRWLVLQMEGLFTGQDVIKAVNKKFGSDYSKTCWEILDKLSETPLLERVGQNTSGMATYKVNL